MTCTSRTGVALIVSLCLAASSGAYAQTAPAPDVRLGLTSDADPGPGEGHAGESATEIAKKLQNPVGDLISVPFTNYTNFNVGPNKGTQDILQIQPVVPIHVNEDWNVITRTVLGQFDPCARRRKIALEVAS